MALKKSRDEIDEHIPKKKTKMIILGTMAAVNARVREGMKRPESAFYYHNDKNRFWEILQLVFEPLKPLKDLKGIEERKKFLDDHGVALANIIRQIEVREEVLGKPEDKYIFEAFKQSKGLVKFKMVSSEFKDLLKSKPLFFTCSHSPQILDLVDEYFLVNKLDIKAQEKIIFLKTPTRCNAIERSLGWKIRMAQAGMKTKSVSVPTDYLEL